MLEAVIAAIATVALLGCIALLAYILNGMRKRSNITSKGNIEQVETFGVGTPVVKHKGDSVPSPTDDVRVKTQKESLEKPADSMSKRFLALGVLIAGVFGVIIAKLWSMQLLGSKEYTKEAEKNKYTTVNTPAPRGTIYDRYGVALVKNRGSQTILADSDVIDDPDTLRRLSAVLGMPLGVLRQRVQDKSQGAQNRSIIESDVRLRDVAFIVEHSDAFPGIYVEDRSVRDYPYGALAAHALGYTGSPTEDDIKNQTNGQVVELTDVVGKSGVELYYDRVLSGDKGTRRLVVDASGNIVSVVSETEARKGSDLYLSIDAHAQYVADKLLAEKIAPDGNIGSGLGTSGGVVAMDLRDGGIAVMASYPTFDPSYLSDGIPQDIWDLYNSDESHAPLMNRIINGQFAPASTFKPFTAMAALENNVATTDEQWVCTGVWTGFGSANAQKCWEHNGHGPLDLHGGLVNSCDVVFYDMAKGFFDEGPNGSNKLSETALQDYLTKYNFGVETGIDLYGESTGILPTPEWKAYQWRNVPSEASWVGGDYTNIIIGQGDVLATPMQVLSAYSGLATGEIMKPHLISKVKNSSGDTVLEVGKTVVSKPEVHEGYLQYIRDSLHEVVSSNSTLKIHYDELGLDVAAKSGTAEHTDKGDDAWFCAWAPYDDPKFLVTVIIEGGEAGAGVAGPIAGDVLATLLQDEAAYKAAQDAGENFDAASLGMGYIQPSSGKTVASKNTTKSTGRQD